jgi:hypothetical protein
MGVSIPNPQGYETDVWELKKTRIIIIIITIVIPKNMCIFAPSNLYRFL